METTIGTDIELAASLLRNGDLVAIPTETVYGLAGNALNEDAVLKIFKAKERPQFNPLIIHLPSWENVNDYVSEIPTAASILASHFVPGPITFLLPKNDHVPDLVTAGSPKVAVRVPGHPLTHVLLEQLGFPLAAPSANRFGYVSPVTAQHVYEGLAGRIPYILDGGACPVGVESTIVDFEGDEVIIRRHGKVSVAEIEKILGQKVLVQTSHETHPVAPGMLKSHYATSKPLFIGKLDELNYQNANRRRLILGWGSEADILAEAKVLQTDPAVAVRTLSDIKSIDEVAKNLFTAMRLADAGEAEVILVPFFPEAGIGAAINDRLRRACHTEKQI